MWAELATAAQDDSLSEIIDSLLQKECVKEPMILFQAYVRRMKYREAMEVLRQVLTSDADQYQPYETAFAVWQQGVSRDWKAFNIESIVRVLHTNKKGFTSDVPSRQIKKAVYSMHEPDIEALSQIHGFLGEYDEGIELLRDIGGWENLRALKIHVELLTATKMYDKAIEECNKALSHAADWLEKERRPPFLGPDFESRVLYYKASVLNAEGKGKEAIKICDHACRRRPDPRFSHLFRGIMKRWLADDRVCHLVPEYAFHCSFLRRPYAVLSGREGIQINNLPRFWNSLPIRPLRSN